MRIHKYSKTSAKSSPRSFALPKGKNRALLASKRQPGSAHQIALVSFRVSRGRCIECGGARAGDGDFCVKCLSVFPKRTDIAAPIDAWQFFVVQTKPAIPGFMAFVIWREGVYERKAKPEWLGWADSLKEAEAIAQKKRDRVVACAS
jgi:hypothetical protein